MDRLTTRREDNGLAYLVGVRPNEQEVDSPHPNTLKCILECFERLAAYEDTGLMPNEINHIRADLVRYQRWVSDLQDGMYINCVYCGHRYGPEDQVPASMAEALKEHIEQCPEHPMSKLRAEIDQLRTIAREAKNLYEICADIPIDFQNADKFVWTMGNLKDALTAAKAGEPVE